MTIEAGAQLPDVNLTVMGANGPQPVGSRDLLGSGRCVLFAVPGAFTPTCSAQHLPGFLERADELRSRGVDRVVCTAVNDIFVMDAWARSSNVEDRVLMAADGNGEFAAALGMEMDASGFGMGKRSQRYAMILNDGRVEKVLLEGPGEFRNSSAENVLAQLDAD